MNSKKYAIKLQILTIYINYFIILFLAIIFLFALMLSGCGLFYQKGKRLDRDVLSPIVSGHVVKHEIKNSNYTIILIPDRHDSYACHASIYLTLESLPLDEIKFIARQERVGPTEHTNEDFKTHRYYDHKLRVRYYRDIIKLSFKERIDLVHRWIEQYEFPSVYVPVRDWNFANPMFAPVLFEVIYQDKVKTIGVEGQKELDLAKALTGPFSKADLTTERSLKILFEDRNIKMLENIDKYSKEAGGKYVPFIVGWGHVYGIDEKNEDKSLLHMIKDRGISYWLIEHGPCIRRD